MKSDTRSTALPAASIHSPVRSRLKSIASPSQHWVPRFAFRLGRSSAHLPEVSRAVERQGTPRGFEHLLVELLCELRVAANDVVDLGGVIGELVELARPAEGVRDQAPVVGAD